MTFSNVMNKDLNLNFFLGNNVMLQSHNEVTRCPIPNPYMPTKVEVFILYD